MSNQDKQMSGRYISRHLTLDEYACHHCHLLPPDFFINDIRPPFSTLFDIYDDIVDRWGEKIIVDSAYRCPFHNKEVGGKALSVHQFGLALDLLTGRNTTMIYNSIVKHYPELRLGKYPTFIHMDIGYLIHPRGSHYWHKGARWSE